MTLATVDLRPSEREVLAALRGRGAVSPVEIERLLPHRDARTIRTARTRLLELGLVVVSGTPSRPRVALAAGGEPAVPDPDATRARTGRNPGPDPDARAVSSSVRRLQGEVEAAAAAASLEGSGSGWLAEAVHGLRVGIEALAGLLRARGGHLAPRPEGAGLRPQIEDATASPANKPVDPLKGPQITGPSEGPRIERERHGCGNVVPAGNEVAKPFQAGTPLRQEVADALDEREREHAALVGAGRAKPLPSPGGWRATVGRALEANADEREAVLKRRRARLAREAAVAKAYECKTVSREARASVRQVEAEEQRQAVDLRRAIEALPAAERAALRARAEDAARAKGKRPGSPTWLAAVALEEERLAPSQSGAGCRPRMAT